MELHQPSQKIIISININIVPMHGNGVAYLVVAWLLASKIFVFF